MRYIYIELWHILSLLLILCVNYYIGLKARRTPLLYTFFAAQLMLGLWMIAKIGKTVSRRWNCGGSLS
jgi:hypothetical protein